MKREKFIVYFAALLDVLSISILIPIYPALVATYWVDYSWIAAWLVMYGVCALVATPLLGQRSDRVGRKYPLLLCIVGTALSFLLLYLVPTYRAYMLSRAINGITWGNISILQSIISDTSKTPQERQQWFGILWALFGMSFIIWPLIGWVLWQNSVYLVFAAGFMFALLEAIFVYFVFRETHHELSVHRIQRNPLKLFNFYAFSSKIKYLIRTSLLFSAWFFATVSVLANDLQVNFWWTPRDISYFLAFSWLIGALNQWLLLGIFWSKIFTPRTQIIFSLSSAVVLFIILGLIYKQSVSAFVVFYGLMALLTQTAWPVLQSMMLNDNREKTWEISWIWASIMSLAQVVWPLLGTLAVAMSFPQYFITAACMSIALVVFLQSRTS